jgi:pimeloyl-ACP methyl ester carboxylesterase
MGAGHDKTRKSNCEGPAGIRRKDMATATANGIQIEYDTFGDKSSRPLLLIMGLSDQMIMWDEEFCEQLAAKGHYVIRFDNRDVGLSTKFDEAGIPDLMEAMLAMKEGKKIGAPYSLDDMADDSVGLLDALGIDKAHICGISMGGMIAQTMTIRHAERVSSLTSIMSSPNAHFFLRAKPDVMDIFLTPPPEEREAYIEYGVKLWEILCGSHFPFNEDWFRKKLALCYDRCFYPQGVERQLAAVLAHGDRTHALKSMTAPTLVIHGADDPIIPVDCGEATAEAVRGATFLAIEGMGHDLPVEVWPQVIDAITAHTQKAQL